MSIYASVGRIDLIAGRSPARHWNPVFKLLFALAVLFLCLGLNRIAVSLYVAGSMAALSLAVNRVSVREYLRLLCIPVAFILMGTAAIAVELRQGGGFALYISEVGLREAVSAALRAFGAVSALYFLALSTTAGDLTGALRTLHMPELLIELMYLIYRFIFIMLDSWMRMRTAAAARLGYGDYKTSLKTFGCCGGNLLVLSLKRGREMYQAMEARGYDGRLYFWTEKKNIKAGQVIAALLYLLSMAGVGLWGPGGIFT